MVPWSWFLENDFKKYVERVTSTSKKKVTGKRIEEKINKK